MSEWTDISDSYKNSALLDAVNRINGFLLLSPVSVQLSYLS